MSVTPGRPVCKACSVKRFCLLPAEAVLCKRGISCVRLQGCTQDGMRGADGVACCNVAISVRGDHNTWIAPVPCQAQGAALCSIRTSKTEPCNIEAH